MNETFHLLLLSSAACVNTDDVNFSRTNDLSVERTGLLAATVHSPLHLLTPRSVASRQLAVCWLAGWLTA